MKLAGTPFYRLSSKSSQSYTEGGAWTQGMASSGVNKRWSKGSESVSWVIPVPRGRIRPFLSNEWPREEQHGIGAVAASVNRDGSEPEDGKGSSSRLGQAEAPRRQVSLCVGE